MDGTRKVKILKSAHYSYDSKVLWLEINQECRFPETYAAALVLTGAAAYVGAELEPPTTEPTPEPTAEELAEVVEATPKKVVSKKK